MQIKNKKRLIWGSFDTKMIVWILFILIIVIFQEILYMLNILIFEP